MKIVTIIVNYKTPEMTLESVNSAVKELEKLESGWTVFIVDNDSRDDSVAHISNALAAKQREDSTWDNVNLFESPANGGFGAGNNIGIRKHLDEQNAPDYFYILNSDAFPENNSIRHLVNYMDAFPDFGIAGSYIHGVDGEPHPTAFRFPTAISEFEEAVGFGPISKLCKKFVVSMAIPPHATPVNWTAGASMLLRTKMLREIGIFDERFFLYFEETDLCHRAIKAGWKTVYVTESSVAHVGSASTGRKEWQSMPEYWFDSRSLYYRKNYGTAYLWLANFTRITGEIIHKLRVLIQPSKQKGPSRFLLDLMRHSFKLR